MQPAAEEFCDLFPAVYLHFGKRPGKDRRLTPQMSAVPSHLSLSGPLTVGEMAVHFDRAALEKKTLAYMATMPAWKDHPRVRAAASDA